MLSTASRQAATDNATQGVGSLTKHAAELGRWSRAASLAGVASLAFDRSNDSHAARLPWGPATGSRNIVGESWSLSTFRWQELVMLMAACLLPVVLISGTAMVGKLPQASSTPELLFQGGAVVANAWPPMRVMFFASAAIIGISANITIVQTSTLLIGAGASTGIAAVGSGLWTGGYCMSVLAGVFFFARFPVEKQRTAFQWQALFMLVGNSCFVLIGLVHNAALLYAGRLLVGFTAGSMYTAMQAYAHSAQGSSLSACMMLAQFFVAVGVLLGPSLAYIAVRFGDLLPRHVPVESIVCGTMALGGAVQFFALHLVQLSSPEKEVVTQNAATPKSGFARGFAPAHHVKAAPILGCARYVRTSRLRCEHFALLSMMMSCGVIRAGQRLLLENGAIALLEQHYGWCIETSGYFVFMVGAASAASLLMVSFLVAGSVSDAKLMWYAEFVQIFSVGLLLFSTLYISTVGPLLLLGSVVYCTSAVWGGASMAFCLKRQVTGSKVASLQTLLMANQIAMLLGTTGGSVISSVMLAHSISVRTFALLMLAPCILQTVTRVLSS